MAALCVRTAFLLVLLAMSCPGSEAMVSQQLCGSELIDALEFVCGDRGFFNSPRTGASGASVDGENQGAKIASKGRKKKQDITLKCCYSSCSFSDLEKYC